MYYHCLLYSTVEKDAQFHPKLILYRFSFTVWTTWILIHTWLISRTPVPEHLVVVDVLTATKNPTTLIRTWVRVLIAPAAAMYNLLAISPMDYEAPKWLMVHQVLHVPHHHRLPLFLLFLLLQFLWVTWLKIFGKEMITSGIRLLIVFIWWICLLFIYILDQYISYIHCAIFFPISLQFNWFKSLIELSFNTLLHYPFYIITIMGNLCFWNLIHNWMCH